jgi:hypothetical protein
MLSKFRGNSCEAEPRVVDGAQVQEVRPGVYRPVTARMQRTMRTDQMLACLLADATIGK